MTELNHTALELLSKDAYFNIWAVATAQCQVLYIFKKCSKKCIFMARFPQANMLKMPKWKCTIKQ